MASRCRSKTEDTSRTGEIPAWSSWPNCRGGPHDRAQNRAALRSGPAECSSPASPLMTVAEAAAFLSVSTKTVRRLIAQGALGYVKIGRSIRLRREVIDRYISDCSSG
jgi:excisionase family DNA binding protein